MSLDTRINTTTSKSQKQDYDGKGHALKARF